MAEPQVYIVAGPNGAGKTTFARKFLTKYANCDVFVNADEIAKELAPSAPESVALRAGRIMLEELHRLAGERRDFGFETTLSGRTYLQWLKQLREQGYAIHLFFLWLPSVEMALDRVASRVRQGGHNIPEPDVRRRYGRGVRNLLQVYRPVLDHWFLFENSAGSPATIAYEEYGQLTIVRPDLYKTVVESSVGHE